MSGGKKSKPFHHKHLPVLTKGTKSIVWTILHLYFPFIVHFLTDKYKDKHHHLIVDTIYAAVSIVLFTVNAGLAVWFFLYFTPANVEVHIFSPTELTNGEESSFLITYLNNNRNIQDVEMDIYLPEEMVISDTSEMDTHLDIGDLSSYSHGMARIEGVIYGNVGETYSLRTITSYTYLGRRQFEVEAHEITIIDSKFETAVSFEEVTSYESEVNGTVTYNNMSPSDYDEVVFTLDYPSYFSISSVQQESETLNYDHEKKQIVLTSVQPNEEGVINFVGTFHFPDGEQTLSGDALIEIGVVASTRSNTVLSSDTYISHGTERTAIEVLAPSVVILLTGQETMHLTDDFIATVIVYNVSDNPVEQVNVEAEFEGTPLLLDDIRVRDYGEETILLEDIEREEMKVTFPEQKVLEAGAQKRWMVTVPTALVEDKDITSSMKVSGTMLSTEHNASVAIQEESVETKYFSYIDLSSEAVYYGPNQEQLGYGPYPPEPWETTGLRILLSLVNTNNTLSNVHIQATASDQTEWTGSHSVTTGTTLAWDEEKSVIDWFIPSLDPQSDAYGAQFEIRFTPNHLQVGQTPHIISNVEITADDTFTEEQIRITADAVDIPVTVSEAQ